MDHQRFELRMRCPGENTRLDVRRYFATPLTHPRATGILTHGTGSVSSLPPWAGVLLLSTPAPSSPRLCACGSPGTTVFSLAEGEASGNIDGTYAPPSRISMRAHGRRLQSGCGHGGPQCKSRGRQRNNSGLMSSLTKLPSMPCLLRLLRCSMPCPEALGPFHAMFRATHIMADCRLIVLAWV